MRFVNFFTDRPTRAQPSSLLPTSQTLPRASHQQMKFDRDTALRLPDIGGDAIVAQFLKLQILFSNELIHCFGFTCDRLVIIEYN